MCCMIYDIIYTVIVMYIYDIPKASVDSSLEGSLGPEIPSTVVSRAEAWIVPGAPGTFFVYYSPWDSAGAHGSPGPRC